MLRIHMAACLVLIAGLSFSTRASAGWFGHHDDPPPSYSPFRYWTPGLARLHDHFHGPYLSPYAPDRHPEIPPDYAILKFPHPVADPAATLIPVPTPPPTSRFRY